MQLEDVADLMPGPGQVVVRVRAAGVNPVDSYIRSGTQQENLLYLILLAQMRLASLKP